MKTSLLPLLRCTSGCEVELILDAGKTELEEIIAGSLCCSECGREYPIECGIARMLPKHLVNNPIESVDEATARKISEMQARDEQVGDYDRMWYLTLFGKIEIPVTLFHLSPARQHTVLEAGCGTGRMTREFASKCDQLVSADFSWESLKVCASKLRSAGIKNVNLIQADICHLPLKTNTFERVVSCQVLEHIPTPECRAMAVDELSRVLQADGKLVLSAYQHSLMTRLFGEKEGEHDGGIYFYRFGRDELRKLMSRSLKVETITGALVYHYIARCRKT